jgi:arginine N-succinyltransferase
MSASKASQVREARAGDLELMAHWRDQAGLNLQADDAGLKRWVWVDAADHPRATLALRARLGLDLPRYSYHVGRVVHAAAELGLFRVQTTLLMGNDHTGQSELCGLATAPDLPPAERREALQALVQAAQASVAAEPTAEVEWLVVELQGWRDDTGSPVWASLGGRFYPHDPAVAEQRLGAAWRSHLAALLPRQTLYLSFLSEAAQRRLGQASSAVAPEAEALLTAGFAPSGHVRIDDGGPILGWRVPRGAAVTG